MIKALKEYLVNKMITYKCGKCGKNVDIDTERMGIKCPHCGGKIFYKERGTIAKKLKAV